MCNSITPSKYSILTVLINVFYIPERDPAAVYSAVKRTEDVSYGQIVVKSNRTRGTAALLFFF